MPQFKELNNRITLEQQMQTNEDGSIVLINVFTVDSGDETELIERWSHDAEFLKSQPGYISAQMHKGIGESTTYVNYAIWESVESFRRAFAHPEFQRRIANYPESASISPHLFKKIGVKG